MNMRQTFHPVALFALALCFATTSGLAQREVKPTVLKVPHQQMRVAFEKFQTVESLTGTTATSVLPTALSVDVNATAETIFVASSPSARLHLKADENVPLPLRVGVPQPDASGGMAVIEPFVRCSAFVRRDAVFRGS